ncbi:unnamed protein product [Phytophthora fragariaefolia]|uniref:Unnamed protein product n=1 Tax=Phytophthora fragariaefolia TaxID=1490495 RepID=A0A9W7CV82_9STRA|nr:unnamed protein product [Phytophthora fragariaefolia]
MIVPTLYAELLRVDEMIAPSGSGSGSGSLVDRIARLNQQTPSSVQTSLRLLGPSGSPPPSSTSNTANSPGNADISAPSSDSDATSRFVPPVVDLVPSGADTSSLRSALEIISTTLKRTEAYDALHADHAALQQAYRASRSRVHALETELQGAAAAASPFVQFRQQRYDVLRNTLEATRICSTECQNALAERLDNSRELQDMRELVALPWRIHAEAIKALHDQIGRLESQVITLQSSASTASPQQAQRIQQLEASLAQAQADREASEVALRRSQEDSHVLEASQQALETSTQQLRRQIDTLARRQLSGLVNLVRPATASPCRPSSPSHRRRRSRPPSAGGDFSRPRRRARPSSSSPRGSSSASRPHSGSRSSPARNPPPSARGRSSSAAPPEAESSGRTTSEPDSALSSDINAAPPADRVDPRDLVESSEDEVLPVLSRTRSEERRRSQANSRRSNADLPIDLNSSSSSSDSDPSGHPQPAAPAPATSRRRTRSSRRGASGSSSSRTPVAEEGGGHGDQAQAHQGANDEGGAGMVQPNQLPANSCLASLPATRIPRSQWVLGFRQRRHCQAVDVAPWPLAAVLATSVSELALNTVFQQFHSPLGWLYPLRTQAPIPPQDEWLASLVTESTLVALLATQPWEVLNTPVVPMSFDMAGEFESLAVPYVAFEEEHRQAYWEATHTIPISLDLREAHPGLDQYYTTRKQRRSRAGGRWKSFLRQVLKGMLAGHRDLDIRLDPPLLPSLPAGWQAHIMVPRIRLQSSHVQPD